ncbi:hypothetical protein [Entomospira culicis]|uniref:Uncharacterized protein n=1 Tax=Entomospira culicis TaxID=2719989 RepID=A0A968GHW7_9SPIO|nr:hypothetical protein [Entomospira culicis]NIZ19902.1 hypothetical protein [Entomospira culicis]NIZ70141.1 hypothetical protein [Entomospira culicis]WDI38068.1 hypothetical protein PVA46_07970 [Entomospira culicis]WDI39691.1 hypothetical protein PVA47_07970 [Entomospira culicis]
MQSQLLLPFFLQVLLPIVLLLLAQALLHYSLEAQYRRLNIDELYLNENKKEHPTLQRLRDIRLTLKLLTLPLLILLFFNFQNTLQHQQPPTTRRSAQQHSNGLPSFGESQASSPSERQSNREAERGGLQGQRSPFFGWVLFGMLLLTLGALFLLRIHPHASYPLVFQPKAWLEEINSTEIGENAWRKLRRWWQIQLPIIMVIQLKVLPYHWQMYLNYAVYGLSLLFIVITLLNVRTAWRIRGRYLELLLEREGDMHLLHWRGIIARRKHDQEARHRAFLTISQEEYEAQLTLLRSLFIVISLLGYYI